MTGEALGEKLASYQALWEVDACGILLEDGQHRLADGTEIVFANEIDMRDVLSYSQQLNVTQQTIGGREMLVFAKPCQLEAERKRAVGIFAALDMAQMETMLGEYGYGTASFLALTKSNGDNIWKQGDERNGADGNCLEDLARLKVDKSDSVQQMKTRMSAAMDGTLVYEKNGQEHYLAYVPLQVNYWYLIVSTQASSIDFTALSRQYFVTSGVLVAVIVVMGLFGLLYLVQRNRSILAHNEQLRQATILANQANAAKRDFLAKVSHEIRTPPNGVMGMIALAKREYAEKDQCLTYLDKAEVSSEQLLGLIDDVLDMSQIESGRLKLLSGQVDMVRLQEDVEAIVETSAQKRGLSIRIDGGGLRHRYFTGDALRLKQILTNFISNAIKYTDPGGSILVELRETEEEERTWVTFRVRDDGEGIPQERLDEIFKPFEQAAGQSRGGGVGLGLAIVKNIVELMGGRIAVESAPGKGSTFLAAVPLAVREAAETAPASAPAALQGVSILLAEDNELNAEIAMKLLSGRGAAVTLAADGQEAVERFRQTPPGTYQVILMDIQMPRKNGLQATAEIRALDRPDGREIPILAMTANAFEEQREEMERVGMNDFLYKPMDLDKVCACIRNWISGGIA